MKTAHTPTLDINNGLCIMEICTHVKNADGRERLMGERDAFHAIERLSKNGDKKTQKNIGNKKPETISGLGKKGGMNLMLGADGIDRQSAMQRRNNAEDFGFFLAMLKECSLSIFMNQAAGNVSIAPPKLAQDLRHRTQGDLTMLFPEQRAVNTQSKILSYVAGNVIPLNLINKAVAAS